jgi:hypothetical protein
MAAPPLTFKRDRATQPIYFEALTLNEDGTETPINLTNLTIEVKLVAGELVQTLDAGNSGITKDTPLLGLGHFTMTAARMTALGTPRDIDTTINFYAADGALVLELFERVRVAY